MAFRMQTSAPSVTNSADESPATLDLYGPDVRTLRALSPLAVCSARRMAERSARVVQILHRGWDQHGNSPGDHRLQCLDTDQACYALVTDLKQRGLLEDTLVVWAGEFGRTVYFAGHARRRPTMAATTTRAASVYGWPAAA